MRIVGTQAPRRLFAGAIARTSGLRKLSVTTSNRTGSLLFCDLTLHVLSHLAAQATRRPCSGTWSMPCVQLEAPLCFYFFVCLLHSSGRKQQFQTRHFREASRFCKAGGAQNQNPRVSSADGPYVAGTGMSFRRRYTPSWAR